MCEARRVVIDSFGLPEVMRLETVTLPRRSDCKKL